MELNVKQSGIEERTFVTKYFKSKAGRIFKTVHEKYLRNDISCGSSFCQSCKSLAQTKLKGNPQKNNTEKESHAVLVDPECFIRFFDIFDSKELSNIVICQSVWDYVKKKSLPAYKKMNALVYEDKSPRFFVFFNDLHHKTYTPSDKGESEEQRQGRALVRSAEFLSNHWNKKELIPLIVCGDEDTVASLSKTYPKCISLKKYLEGLKCDETEKGRLLSQVSVYEKSNEDGKTLFEEHLPHDEIVKGIASGRIKKAQFTVSRENYREATVMVDDGNEWFITGKHANRAIHGDTVAVELLDESEWTAPQKSLVLRDIEEATLTADVDALDVPEETEDDEPASKRRRKEVVPTAKVVGIVRRNWRPYCGILLPSILKGGRRHLFCPAERLIPRIRIETEQAEQLASQRIVVCLDSWPRDSKYPLGHYVRTLGTLGERDVENEVILLEHDIPHAPFSQAVLDCLPKGEWKPEVDKKRVDLRHLCICSVDPKGCTDIDDALHARELPDGTFEVGVHIADVTHFVRPNTAMDEEAAMRGTTVYMADRRIDMLPELLSSNLCSLRGEEERYAFSVIWTMTRDAHILSAKFHKSLIKSRAALTYEKAQEMINDLNDKSEITTGLRLLLDLSRILTQRRRANGSLILASSEVRFDMDWDTKTPKSVLVKGHLDTHSLVEEFMLLANISVAEKILAEYPDCALLRRHPVPSESSYKPLIEAARKRGFDISVDSGKVLADCLDRAVDERNPMVNTLLRMMATRCMTQAVYFSAGTIPVENYQHFGLACPIYTHFTSPIRRYADVIVHRLLAASIGADSIKAGLLSQANVKKVAANINYRHKQAQYAGRASTQLITLTYFRGKEEEADAFVAGIRKNGIQVYVPKYGIEAVIVVKGTEVTVDVDEGRVTSGGMTLKEMERVKVRISVDESNVQRPRIGVQLIKPAIPGLSVDFDLSSEQGKAKSE